MKRKDITNLHSKTQDELHKDLDTKVKEFKQFNLEKKVKQVKNFHLGERLRDDIARIKTIIRQKQIQERMKP